MFSHRLTQFVWHIWRKYRYHISFRNGGVDAFSQRMYSLVGLGHRQLRDKLAINHSKMLAYSGILANPGRSPEIICGLVSHCFDLSEVTLQNWQRRKVDIEPDQQIVWGAILLKMAKNWREDRYWATLFWVHECPSSAENSSSVLPA